MTIPYSYELKTREDYMLKVKDLRPRNKKVAIEIHVLRKDEPKAIKSKRDRTAHIMVEALVGDDTGTILMTLWDENVDAIEQGKTYFIDNAHITLFHGSMRLNIGKYCEIRPIEKKFQVDEKSNVSEKIYEESRRSNDFDKFSSGSFWPDH